MAVGVRALVHVASMRGEVAMKILLAIDGSPCSERAVEEVARRPWPADSQVRVVSVIEPPAPLVAEPCMSMAGYFEEAERLKRKQAVEVLESSAVKLRGAVGSAGLQVSTEVLN